MAKLANVNEKINEMVKEVILGVEFCKTILEKDNITLKDCDKIKNQLNKTEKTAEKLRAIYNSTESPKSQIKESAFLAAKSFAFDILIAFQDYRMLVYKILVPFLEKYATEKKDLN